MKDQIVVNDITLLQLDRPVEYNPHVIPACIPSPNLKVAPNTACWITGWGYITEDALLSAPFRLQEAEVVIVEQAACEFIYQPPVGVQTSFILKDSMICAGQYARDKAICRGDSGGPLVCKYGDAWNLIGLTSWSTPCSKPVGPSVFTRVTNFTGWIDEQKQENPTPNPTLAPPQGPPPAILSLTAHATRTLGVGVVLLAPQTFLLLPLLLGSL
ncbi:serine protease 40-like [Carlito syrichta]|uniref:Serine protease 40-like n=1 Tax=Carlito syrichta TaxID=1868482 RepID=A0A1U7SFT3_CARSF|nr:serine protease 40-like [Carlito syrichta]